MSSNSYRRGGVVWPVLLVLVGLLLLLNNLGITDQSFWTIASRLWPTILLAIGVDILIPRRSAAGTALALMLVAAIFIGGYILVDLDARPTTGALQIEQLSLGVQTADVTLEPAVGRIQVDTGASGRVLLSGFADPIAGRQPRLTYSTEANRGSLRLVASDDSVTLIVPPRLVWDLTLTEAIPLHLRADLGVGEMLLSLREARLEGLEASFGVGRAEVSLPDGQDLEVRIEGGVGEIVVRVPTGAEVKVEFDGGISTLALPSGYERTEYGGHSPEAPAATPDITLRLELGVGSVRIVER